MVISAFDPITPALHRTGKILFQPFNLGKWFVIGFTAWLAMLGESGGSLNFWNQFSGGGRGGGPVSPGPQIHPSAIPWIISAAIVFILLVIGLTILIMWLSSRGKFMFMENLVHDSVVVKDPWAEYRKEGNSLFRLRILIHLFALLYMIVLIGSAVVLAWDDFQRQVWGSGATSAIIVGILGLLPYIVIVGLVKWLISAFIQPIMYIDRVPWRTALSIFHQEILAGNTGAILLYMLVTILISLAVGMLASVAVCATCCIAALPYLGTVILLPLFVFDQSYKLYYLAQFGPRFAVISDAGRCPICRYSLRGLPLEGLCPECGTPYPAGHDGRPNPHSDLPPAAPPPLPADE